MAFQSARQLLGQTVVQNNPAAENTVFGIIETVTINPKTMRVDGLLVGQAGDSQKQVFIPLQSIVETKDNAITVCPGTMPLESDSRRVIGLQAWTTNPPVFVGFVHDFYLSIETGAIESFVIHQLIRTWRIPVTAVEKITPKALLIENDTTIKLKITPYPAQTL